MKKLTVFYDAECPLCQKAKAWAMGQKAYLELRFRPLQDPSVHREFPDLKRYEPEKDLVVFGDNGAVYRGTEAWLMVLWALRSGRPWSLRLAKPGWRPYVKGFWKWVSEHRHRLGPPPRGGRAPCPGDGKEGRSGHRPVHFFQL